MHVLNNLRNYLALLVLFFAFSAATHGQQRIADLDTTVIMVGIDGFRYDYFEKHGPPVLNTLAREGVRARWMKPVFPSKTFPNFYSIATGLYPANHGIVENNVWDFGTVFTMSKRDEVENPRWWLGEPIWITAEKNNIVSAAMFFPGTETEIMGLRPTYWNRYDHNRPKNERVDTVLGWLDLPKEKRPQLITMYFHDIDSAGHDFGPDAVETKNAVLAVDKAVERLVDGLRARGIFERVNLIFFADHGMAPTNWRNVTFVDDFIRLDDAERIIWTFEFLQIFPKAGKEAAMLAALQKMPHAKCWAKADIPKRFNYRHGKRVAPIVCSSDVGRIFSDRVAYQKLVERGSVDKPHGGHGYDNDLVEMRAMFAAHGPAFKRNYVAKPFENVDIYNLVAKILDIEPAPNDGKFKRLKKMLR